MSQQFENPGFDLKEWKKQKLAAIRAHHADLIKDLGISPYDFNMKKAFYDQYGREVVGIFASEFNKEKGFYFELISSDLDPIDPERKVYRVPSSTTFEEEYELNPKNSYSVPLEELKVINPTSVAINKFSAVKAMEKPKEQQPQRIIPQESIVAPAPKPTLNHDAPFSDMTIKDLVAILLRKPVSDKPWLNELVK